MRSYSKKVFQIKVWITLCRVRIRVKAWCAKVKSCQDHFLAGVFLGRAIWISICWAIANAASIKTSVFLGVFICLFLNRFERIGVYFRVLCKRVFSICCPILEIFNWFWDQVPTVRVRTNRFWSFGNRSKFRVSENVKKNTDTNTCSCKSNWRLVPPECISCYSLARKSSKPFDLHCRRASTVPMGLFDCTLLYVWQDRTYFYMAYYTLRTV